MVLIEERAAPGDDLPAGDDIFAVSLAMLRIIRRMSQGDLAKAAGVTNSAVSD